MTESLSWRRGTFIFARLGVFLVAWMCAAMISAFVTQDMVIHGRALRGVLLGGVFSLPLAVLCWLLLDVFYFSKRWDYLTGNRALVVALTALVLFAPVVVAGYTVFFMVIGPDSRPL